MFFFFKQKTAYEMRISDWSSDVCSSDLGLVRTFQNVRLFKNLTVLENLLVAQHTHIETRLLPGLFKVPSFRRSEQEAQKNAVDWLAFMGIRQFANREARSEEHTSELQSLMRISYAVFSLKNKHRNSPKNII